MIISTCGLAILNRSGPFMKNTYWTGRKHATSRCVSGQRTHLYSQFSNNGRVSRQGLGRQFVVAVRAVEEGLAALAVARLVGMENQTWTRRRLQLRGTAAQRRTIFPFKAKRRQRETTAVSKMKREEGQAERIHQIDHQSNHNHRDVLCASNKLPLSSDLRNTFRKSHPGKRRLHKPNKDYSAIHLRPKIQTVLLIK